MKWNGNNLEGQTGLHVAHKLLNSKELSAHIQGIRYAINSNIIHEKK